MSVQRNQYFCYGYMLDFKEARNHLVEILGEDGYTDLADKYYDNAFTPNITEVHGCSMIEDGMNGKYTFFGKIYAKSENYEVIETMEIPEVSLHDKIITDHEFRRVFEGFNPSVEPVAKFYVITHYR